MMQYAINYESREIRCTYCGGIFLYRVDFDRHSCNAVLDEMRKRNDSMQLPPQLTQVFKDPGSRTLKLEKKAGATLEETVRAAYMYVREEGAAHTRIEFKFEDCYIVVAKLKDKE
jgi:hypothetical protein